MKPLKQWEICLSVLTEAMPVNGLGTHENMNSLALLPRKAVQTIWLGKACGVESQRGWGRAQRAGGERRAPGNMLAQPAAGEKVGRRRGRRWGWKDLV